MKAKKLVGTIKPVISNRFKPNQATEALQMPKDVKILGRGIIYS